MGCLFQFGGGEARGCIELGLTLQNAPRFFGGKGLVLEAEKKKKKLKKGYWNTSKIGHQVI
jgi:hypothetical protein